MIESGSHTGDIDVTAWRIPEGTALRYERPAAGLQDLIADYAVLDSDLMLYKGGNSWLLPASAKIWVALTAQHLHIATRSRKPAELGVAMLIGPSSVTMPVEAHGGISVVISPTPRGWARLFSTSAEDARDRMFPLEGHRPAEWVADLVARLLASDRGAAVKGVLDDFLTATMPPPTKHEALIGRIERLVAHASSLDDVSHWHAEVGLENARALARACSRYFGFGPKILQRRRRFLRVFTQMLMTDGPIDHRMVPPGYHDVPHFLRDARHFLGMTPRQFLAMPMVYLRAVLRSRNAVIGEPWALLD